MNSSEIRLDIQDLNQYRKNIERVIGLIGG